MKKSIFIFLLLREYLFADMSFLLENLTNPSDELTLWLSIFGLGFIGILALFLSSEKIRIFQKESAKLDKHKEAIQNQHNTILSNMSESIQSIAEGNIDISKKLSKTDDSTENLDYKLLSISTNLIEFLRLKSKKVKIIDEKLSFSNLFNDVSGTLKEIIKETPLELHYILKHNLKENIYSDTLNLSKILVNIILYCVANKADNISLNISDSGILSKNNKLFFTIKTNIELDAKNSDTIFSANYDEKLGIYRSLGIFVARELCFLMGGELTANNNEKGQLEFSFNVTYKKDEETSTSLKVKKNKVLIVDQSDDAAFASKNIFEYLKYNVTTMKMQDYLLKIPDFTEFDLIILDQILFTKSTIAKLTPIDTVISLSNLFGPPKDNLDKPFTNLSLEKPLTRKQVQEFLGYTKQSKETTTHQEVQEIEKTENTLVHKETFIDQKNINLSNFSKFRNTKVLLVEDNLINQKVLLGILSKSGMNIIVATNGQEALDKLAEDAEFDIIFMDINMPIMDGFTATKHIRADKKYDKIPVIALTALTSKMEIDSMFDVGMNGYLAKPLRKEKLFSALALFISNEQEERRKSVRYEERVIKVNGLNTDLGINNSNQNEFFYKEILHEFQDAYGKSDEVFNKLVEDFRYEQLRMLCLDMRGLSASIGAEDMNLLVIEILKLLLFKKYTILKDFVPRYAKSLERLNNSINEYTQGN